MKGGGCIGFVFIIGSGVSEWIEIVYVIWILAAHMSFVAVDLTPAYRSRGSRRSRRHLMLRPVSVVDVLGDAEDFCQRQREYNEKQAVCAHACVCVCVCVCVYACTCPHACLCVCVYALRACVPACARTRLCEYVRARVRAWAGVCGHDESLPGLVDTRCVVSDVW